MHSYGLNILNASLHPARAARPLEEVLPVSGCQGQVGLSAKNALDPGMLGQS